MEVAVYENTVGRAKGAGANDHLDLLESIMGYDPSGDLE